MSELFKRGRRNQSTLTTRRSQSSPDDSDGELDVTADVLKAVTEAAGDAMFVVDAQGRYLFANAAFCQLINTPESHVLGRIDRELQTDARPLEWLDRFHELVWSTGKPCTHDVDLTLRGEERAFHVSQSPYRDEQGDAVGVIAIMRDITEQKRVERELTEHREKLSSLVKEKTAELAESEKKLRFADRMATMGTLSAGIGHDLGNLLLPIRARLDVLNARAHDDVTKADLEAIRVATDYLRRLTNSLRLLSANTETYRSGGSGTVQLSEWWPDVVPLIRNAVASDITILDEIPASCPPLQISPSALTQVLLNLVQNAGDALQGAEREDPRIVVRFALREGGRQVELRVGDNGRGMPEDVKARCLDPFFSTKSRSFSRGLGLSLVQGAISSVGGQIEIDSEVGVGTTFRLLLPIAKGGAAATRRARGQSLDAVVSIGDARRKAHVKSVLSSLRVRVLDGDATATQPEVRLIVTDAQTGADGAVFRFVEDASRFAVVLSDAALSIKHPRVIALAQTASPAELRDALHRVASIVANELSRAGRHGAEERPTS